MNNHTLFIFERSNDFLVEIYFYCLGTLGVFLYSGRIYAAYNLSKSSRLYAYNFNTLSYSYCHPSNHPFFYNCLNLTCLFFLIYNICFGKKM